MTTITRETGDWANEQGESFVHAAPSGRRARRVRFGPGPSFLCGGARSYLIEPGDWAVYELDAEGQPEGEPTYAKTEAAAVDVAEAIVAGHWR